MKTLSPNRSWTPPFISIPLSGRDYWNPRLRVRPEVYHAVLAYELAQRGFRTVNQQAIPVVYGTIRLDIGFRADLIVEDQVIVEIESLESLAPVHKKQLLTYLRLADKRLDLLINFNAALIKDGIIRTVNGLEEGPHAKPPGRQELQ